MRIRLVLSTMKILDGWTGKTHWFLRSRPLAAPAVAVCALLLAGLFLALRLSQPYDGARMEPGRLTVWRHSGVEVTPLQSGSTPLRNGDVVVAVAGRGLASWARSALDPLGAHPSWQAGDEVTYRVLRGQNPAGGSGRLLTLRVRLIPYPLGDVLLRY